MEDLKVPSASTLEEALSRCVLGILTSTAQHIRNVKRGAGLQSMQGLQQARSRRKDMY